jgi:hypothetical protein
MNSIAPSDSGPLALKSNEGLGAGAEARKPTALLDWGLYVDCPKCSLSNNLASGLHDVEHDIARRIFTNEWGKLAGWEVTCEGCGHEFLLGGVEY